MDLLSELPARTRAGRTPLLCRFLTDCWSRFVAWCAWRRSLAALRALDAHQLRDVGLSRADQLRGRPGTKP